LQRKLEERKNNERDRSVSSQPIRYIEPQSSLSALETLEERIQKKSSQGKLEGDKDRQRRRSPTSQSALISEERARIFEERVRRKVSKDSDVNKGHSGDSEGSASSFEERLKRKANRGSLVRQRSSSLGVAVSTSQRKLDDFDTRLQRKLEERKNIECDRRELASDTHPVII